MIDNKKLNRVFNIMAWIFFKVGFVTSIKSTIFVTANYQLPPNPPGLDRSKGRQVVAVNLPFFLPFSESLATKTLSLYKKNHFESSCLISSILSTSQIIFLMLSKSLNCHRVLAMVLMYKYEILQLLN
ncbi:hypothetical protein LV89_02189 [Arcicella aurantiaca]|uniref:Uncharacterized protein n=1 Tax=Arcicella aurantiaca TaxID=591202 RepID=A0A316E9E3_9BACT|nr:hypothetical protein LV89_02189 [Arcicella aurantiaca]